MAMLLDRIESPEPLPRTEPRDGLARDAARLVELLGDRAARRPPRWPTPAFGHEVERVRSHLQPIGSRTLLDASFAREAFQRRAGAMSDGALETSPVRVAYALRWLELGERLLQPPWPALVAGAPSA